jgi:phage baseplate assembly protein gpV
LDVAGWVKASGDVKAGSVSLQNHVHGGVQGGSSQTDKPTA